MELDTKTPLYKTSDKNSFAYVSARERWIYIMTGVVTDMASPYLISVSTKAETESQSIVAELVKLRSEIRSNQHLGFLVDDGNSDIKSYNHDLSQLNSPTWLDVPWLFAECYLYRRINTYFSRSKHWKTYDVFAAQKIKTFRLSQPAVLELAARYQDLMQLLDPLQPKPKHASDLYHVECTPEYLQFSEMCEVCLWGNATDLSLLTELSYEDIQKLQGFKARKASEKHILVNDLPAVYKTLQKSRQELSNRECRVDIILDNAGFELFVDLILGGYLIASGLATKVVYHPKAIPWFVSDVIPIDFHYLFRILENSHSIHSTGENAGPLSTIEAHMLRDLSRRWRQNFANGCFSIENHHFWTGSGSYWRIPRAEPELYRYLRESELVIFKGDLNYRKLTGDAMWPSTTPFSEAIGPVGLGSGVRTLALRTCKADTVVGLKEGEDERLRMTPGGGSDSEARKWAWVGKWAVIQYFDGKS